MEMAFTKAWRQRKSTLGSWHTTQNESMGVENQVKAR